MTNYGKTRYAKILDIQFGTVDTTMVPYLNISIREYFKTKYGIEIKYGNQPLLSVAGRKKVILELFRNKQF